MPKTRGKPDPREDQVPGRVLGCWHCNVDHTNMAGHNLHESPLWAAEPLARPVVLGLCPESPLGRCGPHLCLCLRVPSLGLLQNLLKWDFHVSPHRSCNKGKKQNVIKPDLVICPSGEAAGRGLRRRGAMLTVQSRPGAPEPAQRQGRAKEQQFAS